MHIQRRVTTGGTVFPSLTFLSGWRSLCTHPPQGAHTALAAPTELVHRTLSATHVPPVKPENSRRVASGGCNFRRQPSPPTKTWDTRLSQVTKTNSGEDEALTRRPNSFFHFQILWCRDESSNQNTPPLQHWASLRHATSGLHRCHRPLKGRRGAGAFPGRNRLFA